MHSWKNLIKITIKTALCYSESRYYCHKPVAGSIFFFYRGSNFGECGASFKMEPPYRPTTIVPCLQNTIAQGCLGTASVGKLILASPQLGAFAIKKITWVLLGLGGG